MKNNKLNILVSGSLAIDRIMDFPGYFRDHILPDKIHNLNVSFNISELRENFGGTAGNIAYNLALLGEKPVVLATAGADFAPYRAWLKKQGVDISHVKEISNKLMASAYIITDKDDNQITGFNMGAMNAPLGKFNEKLLKNSLAIVSPGNTRDMEKYARLYQKKKVKYIFDPGQAMTALSDDVLRMASAGAEIVIGNDYEIELLKKRTGWTTDKLADKLKKLIITKGARGSELYTPITNSQIISQIHKYGGKSKIIIRAVKAKVLKDPTGAGDAYRAGLIKGLALGWELEKCAQLASTVASYAVEKYGTQKHYFSWKDLEGRYGITYKESLM
ncbi:MAG: carbohydrate kinase family protein [Patescibacteria group bacterium]|jgi:adenosine kinase